MADTDNTADVDDGDIETVSNAKVIADIVVAHDAQ